MITRMLLVSLMLVSGPAAAVELDLFVTDYGENPAQDQQPLISRPLTYVAPQAVTITTADGRVVVHKSPKKVAVQKEALGDPREAKLFASLGEYEPFSFLLRPRENLEQVLEAAGALLSDSEDMVQKDYGWALKVASKTHQDEVFAYVMRNKSIMPRTALRCAIAKMPEELRREAMKKE